MITWWVAYSGGRDSHVLLHVLSQMCENVPSLSVKAIHVDHGLHPESSLWSQHCAKIAKALKIPLESRRVHLNIESGDSIEAKAREARYAIFEQCLSENDVLMTAHNQDDQAETFLLQALRGAGPKGLGGIAFQKPLGKGLLMRPLLGVTRDEIDHYTKKFKLKYINDPSNDNTQFRRNFLRHEIMPLLKSAFPGALDCLARSSQLCSDANILVEEYCDENYKKYLDKNPQELSCNVLNSLSLEKKCHLLRYWFQQNNFKLPSLQQCQIIIKELLLAKADAKPSIKLPDITIKRFKGKLILLCRRDNDSMPPHPPFGHLLPTAISTASENTSVGRREELSSLEKNDLPFSPRYKLSVADEKLSWGEGARRADEGATGHTKNNFWDLTQPLYLHNQIWRAKKVKGKGIACKHLPEKSLHVTFRQGGERCRLPKRPTKSLKKTLQEMAIPPWERDQIPIFYYQNKMVGMGSLFVCDEFSVTEVDEIGWILERMEAKGEY